LHIISWGKIEIVYQHKYRYWDTRKISWSLPAVLVNLLGTLKRMILGKEQEVTSQCSSEGRGGIGEPSNGSGQWLFPNDYISI
jgi:hypothetical protein